MPQPDENPDAQRTCRTSRSALRHQTQLHGCMASTGREQSGEAKTVRQWSAPQEILFSALGQALITVKLNWAKYPSCQSISESFTFFFRKGILQADELVTAVGWLWTLTLLLSKFATRGARQVQRIPPSTADFCSLLAHRKVTDTKHWGVTAFCSCCGPMWVCTQSFGRAWKHSPLLGCS